MGSITPEYFNHDNHNHAGHDHDHDHDYFINGTMVIKQHASVEGLLLAKIISMIVLGGVSFILGMLPIKLMKLMNRKSTPKKSSIIGHSCDDEQPLVTSMLLCFGGGVLLFTTFVHLQPEVRDTMETLIKRNILPHTEVPLAELVFCGGFFFVYIVEEIVHSVLDSVKIEDEDEAVLHRTMSLRRCSKTKSELHNHDSGTIIPRVSLTTNQTSKSDSSVSGSTTASTQGLIKDSIPTISGKGSLAKSPLDAQVRMTGGPLDTKIIDMRGGAENEDHHGHDKSTSGGGNVVKRSFRGLLAVMALSFHAIFEGLAVGLEMKPTNVWYLFGAVATHKFVIGFCVGVELVSSRTKLPLMLVYIGTFAAVTPIGIGIGILLSADPTAIDSSGSLVATILQGMAAGTLLYVVFFEVLQKERANTKNGFWQLASILAGFLLMLILTILMGHEHSHDHTSHPPHPRSETVNYTTHSQHTH